MHKPILALLVAYLISASAASAQDAGALDLFEKRIRPVLAENCYSCHSDEAKKQRGGLKLDTKEALLKGGDTGPALVPGKPAESLLVKALHYTHEDLKMPPKGKLPQTVVADFEKWIALGAPDPRSSQVAKSYKGTDVEAGRKFWAFQPPKKITPPAPPSKGGENPIDQFILARLQAKGLQMAREADRPTLIRRVYFALIGLPPTPEQIDAFVKDTSPDAFVKVVDGLLDSPHFGERWGRHWLDVARYSESTGGGRTMLLKDAWRYRDYVIRSFNADKPYNRFIMEQIAGDLLPAMNEDERGWQLVALAFLVLGPTNYERQDKPILEMDVIDEQLDTMGRTMLGMTIGCARCHDHKFDPIPTKDYYALAGILKSTKTLIHENVSKWVEKPLPMPPEMKVAVKKHENAVAALKKQIQLAKAAEKKADADTGTEPITKGAIDADELAGIVIDDSQAKKIGSWKHSKFTGNFIGEGYLYDDRGMKAEKTLTFVPDFARGGRYEVRLAYVPYGNRSERVPVRIFHAEGDNTIYVNQKENPPIEGRFISLGTYRFEKGNQWFVMLSTMGTEGHVVADAVQFLREEGEVKTPVADTPASPKSKMPSSKQLEAEMKKLIAAAPDTPQAMCVSEGDKIGDLFVCIRGNVHNRGDDVPRGVLQVATIGPAPVIPPKESGRRQLAEWLASEKNPLTARVMANRVWHHLFGTGLVRTTDNFGSTGEMPSHPELLDHLAIRFVENGWSIKKLIREVILTQTYQQTSEVDASSPAIKQALKADPENRLLWHMSRRRLDAECIRDAILHTSGKLDTRIYGPNMKKGTTIERNYDFDDDVRRSVYTPIFRNRLMELLEVFDFCDPNIPLGRRNTSTVSTQALYLMNSPYVMDQAKSAAKKIMEVKTDDAGRVERAYRSALGRAPTEREKQLALDFLSRSPAQQQVAWERLYQTLFACIDFRYVN